MLALRAVFRTVAGGVAGNYDFGRARRADREFDASLFDLHVIDGASSDATVGESGDARL